MEKRCPIWQLRPSWSSANELLARRLTSKYASQGSGSWPTDNSCVRKRCQGYKYSNPSRSSMECALCSHLRLPRRCYPPLLASALLHSLSGSSSSTSRTSAVARVSHILQGQNQNYSLATPVTSPALFNGKNTATGETLMVCAFHFLCFAPSNDLLFCVGDVVHLQVLGGRHIIILNSYEAANELLNKRAASYSGRPSHAMVQLFVLFFSLFESVPYLL